MLDRPRATAAWLDPEGGDPADLLAGGERAALPALAPGAAEIVRGVPVYDGARIEAADPRAVMAEWAGVLLDGAGVFAVRGALRDRALLDDVTAVLRDLIAREAERGAGAGDHFAASGANARLWNSHGKLALAAPHLFARYASCPALHLASEAWLGPGFAITAQVNLVRPGGAAQTGHRDYHMGFQSAETLGRYPAHVHAMSPMLTLQGAIAHTAMPVESGPTKLLPGSQTYAAGYLRFPRANFQTHFEAHCVQVRLEPGDALFFSPALFHAAGENRTSDHDRMANLFQVSSAYGRPMEWLDRAAMCRAVFPHLRALDGPTRERAVAATANGYPFPTDLDRDPPVDGLAPPTQADALRRAVAEGWDDARLATALAEHAAKRGAAPAPAQA